MKYDFEIFEERPRYRTGKEPHAAIFTYGAIYLNRHLLKLIGDPDAVTLMYDKTRRVIGLQPQPPSRSNAFPLRQRPGGFGSFVRARNFFKRHAITPEETLAFRKPAITSEGILVLDLNETFSVGGKPIEKTKTEEKLSGT